MDTSLHFGTLMIDTSVQRDRVSCSHKLLSTWDKVSTEGYLFWIDLSSAFDSVEIVACLF